MTSDMARKETNKRARQKGGTRGSPRRRRQMRAPHRPRKSAPPRSNRPSPRQDVSPKCSATRPETKPVTPSDGSARSRWYCEAVDGQAVSLAAAAKPAAAMPRGPSGSGEDSHSKQPPRCIGRASDSVGGNRVPTLPRSSASPSKCRTRGAPPNRPVQKALQDLSSRPQQAGRAAAAAAASRSRSARGSGFQTKRADVSGAGVGRSVRQRGSREIAGMSPGDRRHYVEKDTRASGCLPASRPAVGMRKARRGRNRQGARRTLKGRARVSHNVERRAQSTREKQRATWLPRTRWCAISPLRKAQPSSSHSERQLSEGRRLHGARDRSRSRSVAKPVGVPAHHRCCPREPGTPGGGRGARSRPHLRFALALRKSPTVSTRPGVYIVFRRLGICIRKSGSDGHSDAAAETAEAVRGIRGPAPSRTSIRPARSRSSIEGPMAEPLRRFDPPRNAHEPGRQAFGCQRGTQEAALARRTEARTPPANGHRS